MKGGGGWWRERDRGWKGISGGWGKHGIQVDLMKTAFILLTSFSFISNLSFHLCFIKPHIFQDFSSTLSKPRQSLYSTLFLSSSFVTSFLPLSLQYIFLFFFKVFSHQRQFALPSKLCSWATGIFSKCTEKLLHLNMCLVVWLPQFTTGSNLCVAVLFCCLGFIGDRDADVQYDGLFLTVWTLYMGF